MNNVTIKLNSDGVKELLKSSEIQAECMKQAETVQAGLGDGYEVSEKYYPERSGAIIRAVSTAAKKENSEDNSLLKGLGS